MHPITLHAVVCVSTQRSHEYHLRPLVHTFFTATFEAKVVVKHHLETTSLSLSTSHNKETEISCSALNNKRPLQTWAA